MSLLVAAPRTSAVSVTVETTVGGGIAEDFWALYRASFGHLEVRSAARQVLHREEFMAEMQDCRVLKYVARDARGAAVGMSTLTRHLETVPWISPAYFAHHYPDHTARGAVFYLGFTLVHPRYRRSRVFEQMIGTITEVLDAERAVCAWDICAWNDAHLRLGANIEAMLHRSSHVEVEEIDRQTYYAGVFSGRRREG